MKKKIPYIKYALDLIIGVTFALFYNKRVLGGLAFHEIAGIAICGAFLAHVLLNGKWVKAVTLKLFDRKLPGKIRFGYLLNVLLLITMAVIVVSGLIISRVVFPDFNLGNERWFQMLHLSVSYITLVLVAVHVGLHWQWVMILTKKIVKFPSKSKWMGPAIKVAAVLLFIFGAYEIYATGFGTRLASSANIFTTSSQQGEEFAKGQFEENGERSSQRSWEESGERPERPDFEGDGEMPAPPNGGDFDGHFGGEKRGEFGQSASALGVIVNYFGIMSVFAILTYYLGKIKINRAAGRIKP